MDSAQFYELSAYVLIFILGLCIGSFLCVVIYRVPRGMSIFTPPSHCGACGYTLRPYDNIPILSYLLLGGKCRRCRTHISYRYPAVELCNALLWLLSAYLFSDESIVYAAASAVVCSALMCIFCIDIEFMLIYDRFTLTVAVCGVAAALSDTYTTFPDHIIGVIIGGGVFATLYFASLRLIGREGVGFGDVKLAAATGLFLGWQKLLLAMLITSLFACAVILPYDKRYHNDNGDEYPFAPFICIGTAVAMFFGDPILTWYIDLILG